MSTIQLLHGSEKIIETPKTQASNPHNDYGLGFYCTRSLDAAREWACKNNRDGFVNVYEFELEGMKVLNLLDGKHNVLNWIALLLENRSFSLDSEISIVARDYIIENFSIDLSGYDVVIGYRADDSYFKYATDFVSNTLSIRALAKALEHGQLGKQTVIISEKGFERLKFWGVYAVEREIYFPKYIKRDQKARDDYRNELRNEKNYKDDIFVMDILRGEMKSDDARIQQILLR